MTQVNIHEAKTHLSRLINDVVNGKEVVIAKGGKPMVKLVALPGVLPERRLGGLKEGYWMSDDFDDIPADFGDYTVE